MANLESTSELDTRTRLLDAAGPIFARRGFSRATVREICSAANVNIASVGYYFGDKLGLYRQVIAEVHLQREQRFPIPDPKRSGSGGGPVQNGPEQNGPERSREELYCLIHTLLSRMLAPGEDTWELDLLMREMQNPTSVLEDLVRDFFEPMLVRLKKVIRQLIGVNATSIEVEQLALSAVGQCLYYRVGRSVVRILISETDRANAYNIDSLSRHVTAVIVAATEEEALLKQKKQIPYY
ncbi:CerR family C-terminal domain-containing protein [Novipirellula aureliae]|uniref:CerR family C-terminal domain-containing protein n=1 Tax=Novipirellula aureliae TaxID=2527966 RepID=UPI0011B5BC43|nr:CerR family C-terminal domain-containing protein [Novipirellula aureliae]